MGDMTAGHFIYIPVVMLIGVVLGWVLGGRAARDAYAAELRRRESRAKRAAEAADKPAAPGA
ncbi:MAG: hypothetical protein AB7H88_01215 [Vicinamibacterales bacterium]